MRESEVEKHLKKRVTAAGGISYKFVSPGCRGVPDRIVLMPRGHMFFVETKASDGELKVSQERRHGEMRARGQRVYTTYTKAEVDLLMDAFSHP